MLQISTNRFRLYIELRIFGRVQIQIYTLIGSRSREMLNWLMLLKSFSIKMIAKFYDKLLLLVATLCLVGSFVWNFLQTPDEVSTESSSYGEDFWGKSSDGVYFEPLIEHSLMPGDFLYYRDAGGSDKNYSKVQIKSMHLKCCCKHGF